jgi:hypothetical protein
MWLRCENQYQDHLQGKKHRKMVRTLGLGPAATSAVPAAGSAVNLVVLEPEPDPPEDHVALELYSLGGETVGTIICHANERWGQVATRVRLASPHFVPVPPNGAARLTARDLAPGFSVVRSVRPVM